MMKKLLCSLAGVVALGLSAQASAVPVVFDISSSSTVSLADFDGHGGEPGIVFNPRALGRQSAALDVGDTWDFTFFSISFPWVGSGSGTILASLAFDEPLGAPNASSSAEGKFISFFVNAGELTWLSQPGQFSLPNGVVYSVLFENLSGVTLGRSVDVRAYLTLDAQGAPAPGMLVLFGLGVVGVVLANRRRLAAQQKA